MAKENVSCLLKLLKVPYCQEDACLLISVILKILQEVQEDQSSKKTANYETLSIKSIINMSIRQTKERFSKKTIFYKEIDITADVQLWLKAATTKKQ